MRVKTTELRSLRAASYSSSAMQQQDSRGGSRVVKWCVVRDRWSKGPSDMCAVVSGWRLEVLIPRSLSVWHVTVRGPVTGRGGWPVGLPGG